MKVNVTNPILSVKNEPIKDSKEEPFTYQDAIYIALNNQQQNEVLTAEDKTKIFQLSIKLYSGSEVDFTDTERVLIKERAGKILDPLSYGRILELFEEKIPEENPA